MNVINNNATADACVRETTGSRDANSVKVIVTIPPENSYPKSRYPFTPLRLLPLSRFADVGRFYEWKELKENVSYLRFGLQEL